MSSIIPVPQVSRITEMRSAAVSSFRPMCRSGSFHNVAPDGFTNERSKTMSEHPNIRVVNRMTKAVFEQDRAELEKVFTDDFTFHVRGPLPSPGDHRGVDGFLGAMGAIFE